MDDTRFNPYKDATENCIRTEVKENLSFFVENIALKHFKDPDDAQDIIMELVEKLELSLDA